MNRRLPNLAILLGVLGLLPFIALALEAMSVQPRTAGWPLGMLMAYGAVVLAFLGGVHWGIVLQEPAITPETDRIERARLLLGVVPPLIAWLALVVPYVAPVDLALAVLIAGYIAAIVIEDQGRRRGLVPRGYMVLRWALSVVVVALLVTVLVVRLLGARIVF